MNNIVSKCIEETGKELILNNHDIVKYLCSIEEERNTLDLIIQKQYQERKKIEAEIEKLTYKLCLINKSLSMRIKAKNNYDQNINDIKAHYEKLVNSSSTLKKIVEKTQQDLDGIMNKKTGTSTGPQGEEIKTLYVKSEDRGLDDCPCAYMAEVPTKECDSKPDAASSPPRRHSDDLSHDKFGFMGNFDTAPESINQESFNARNVSQQPPDRNTSKNHTNNEKSGTSEEEIEMATVNPRKENYEERHIFEPNQLVENESEELSIYSTEKQNLQLHDAAPKFSITQDISTNVLLSRLKESLKKMGENSKMKPRSELKMRKDDEVSTNDVSNVTSADSNLIRRDTIERKGHENDTHPTQKYI